ncbi:MAG: hypothetical protein IKR73_07070, partial [Oscillospiraceae bacterium]|nr:hypothetical protein [Oscillospiraceae bacterium]
ILIFGTLLIVAGIAMAIALFVEGNIAAGIVAGIICCGLGAFVFSIDGIQKKRYKERNSPGTKAYEGHQRVLNDQKQRVYNKAHHHKTLHDEVNFRSMMIAGVIFGVLALINIIILFASSSWYPILVLAAVIALAFFIYTLTGKDYKDLILKYGAVYADEQMAEADFRTASLYRAQSGPLIIGEKYAVIPSEGKKVIMSDTITWVFGRKQWVYNYTNGIYTGRSDRFYVYICTTDGYMYNCVVDEAAMYVIIDDVLTRLPSASAGYSTEMEDVYRADPAGFAAAAKPAVDKYTIIEPTEE